MPNEIICIQLKDAHICLRVLRHQKDQKRGFQLVEEIKPYEGLLYVLPDKVKPNFWMKDVVQHLDIIFLDADGYVIELIHAKPHRRDVITPPIDTLCAIELAGGSALQFKLRKGSKLPDHHFLAFNDALLQSTKSTIKNNS